MPRVLTEPEYTAIQQQVLASMPKGLSESDFKHMFPSALAGAVATAENSPAPMVGSALGRFVSGLGQSLNPMGLLESIVNPYDPKRAIQQGMAISDQIDKARASRTTSERLGHYAAAAVPPIGIPAANAGETIASGDWAGGAGQAAGLLGPMVVPEVLARGAASQPAQDAGAHLQQVGKGLAKKVGIDPEGMDLQTARNDLQATRLRLQAARSASRQTRLRGEIADLSKPAADATQTPVPQPNPSGAAVNEAGRPIEMMPTDQRNVIPGADTAQLQAIQDAVDAAKRTDRPGTRATPQELDAARKATTSAASPDESSAPQTPSRGRGGAALTRQDARALQILRDEGGLSPAEAQQALAWRKQGVDLETIQKRIEQARQLQASGSFQNLPGPDEAAAQAKARAAESRARSTRQTTDEE